MVAEQVRDDPEEDHQVRDEQEAPDDDPDDAPEILHDSCPSVVDHDRARCRRWPHCRVRRLGLRVRRVHRPEWRAESSVESDRRRCPVQLASRLGATCGDVPPTPCAGPGARDHVVFTHERTDGERAHDVGIVRPAERFARFLPGRDSTAAYSRRRRARRRGPARRPARAARVRRDRRNAQRRSGVEHVGERLVGARAPRDRGRVPRPPRARPGRRWCSTTPPPRR